MSVMLVTVLDLLSAWYINPRGEIWFRIAKKEDYLRSPKHYVLYKIKAHLGMKIMIFRPTNHGGSSFACLCGNLGMFGEN